jgi:hypothetical protein
MHLAISDRNLLNSAAQILDIDAETLMQRYYGSLEDVHYEMEVLDHTGRLQASFAELLRQEITISAVPAE